MSYILCNAGLERDRVPERVDVMEMERDEKCEELIRQLSDQGAGC